MPESGDFKYWIGYAMNKETWDNLIKSLSVKTYPGFSNASDYPNIRNHTSSNYSNNHQSPPRASTPPPSSNSERTESPKSPNFNFNSSRITAQVAKKS